jgi:hypothetical protein
MLASRRVDSSSNRAFSKYIPSLFLAALLLCPAVGEAQQTVPATKTYIRIGHDFLRTVYPELNGKGYTITVETFLSYDDPDGVPLRFDLDVGKGAKYSVTGCCFGGYAGPPPDLASPGACPWLSSPRRKRPDNVDSEGQVHPEQYLSASFVFDISGRLEHFAAKGSSIENHVADNRLHGLLRCNSAMTDEQIATAFKESGAKYGLNDRDEFRKNLPIPELEKFVGKLEVVSTKFYQLGMGDGEEKELPIWTSCDVRMRATQPDGTQLEYRATFDHFDGRLESLHQATTGFDAPKK